MPRQAFHILVGSFIREPGFVGMNAEGRINEIVFLGQANSAIHLVRAIAVADGHQSFDAGLSRPRNHLFSVGVELLAIEMGM
jgi:cob(I)alamin adenosyltransferase